MKERVTGDERSLVGLLRFAYSGERAAAYAYRGHWQSVADPDERAGIRKIEEEEWRHRRQVGEMLAALGAPPGRLLEVCAGVIGRVLGALCHVVGWLAPVYGAGLLESRNIREYEAAARFARACGRDEWLDSLLRMAEVEWDHECYFRGLLSKHWLGRRLPLWSEPPSRASIRRRFHSEARLDSGSAAELSLAEPARR